MVNILSTFAETHEIFQSVTITSSPISLPDDKKEVTALRINHPSEPMPNAN